jgi:hypothetical protein
MFLWVGGEGRQWLIVCAGCRRFEMNATFYQVRNPLVCGGG